jgi:hypothetical protein
LRPLSSLRRQEFTKWLTGITSTGAKRCCFAVVSISEAIAYSALSGHPLETNLVSIIVQTGFHALAAFFAAHGTYTLLTGKTTAPQIEG